jgi:hypothetical protein
MEVQSSVHEELRCLVHATCSNENSAVPARPPSMGWRRRVNWLSLMEGIIKAYVLSFWEKDGQWPWFYMKSNRLTECSVGVNQQNNHKPQLSLWFVHYSSTENRENKLMHELWNDRFFYTLWLTNHVFRSFHPASWLAGNNKSTARALKSNCRCYSEASYIQILTLKLGHRGQSK